MKNVLRECVMCKKEQGRPLRVKEAPPFSRVGVDFAGPLFIKSNKGEMGKAYVALCTCCVMRAVHLDLVTDLTATAFM